MLSMTIKMTDNLNCFLIDLTFTFVSGLFRKLFVHKTSSKRNNKHNYLKTTDQTNKQNQTTQHKEKKEPQHNSAAAVKSIWTL